MDAINQAEYRRTGFVSRSWMDETPEIERGFYVEELWDFGGDCTVSAWSAFSDQRRLRAIVKLLVNDSFQVADLVDGRKVDFAENDSVDVSEAGQRFWELKI